MTRALTVIAFVALAAGAPLLSRTPAASITSIDVPAGAEAGMYSLAASADGTAYVSWLEPTKTGRAFRFAALAGKAWSTPRTITEGRDLFSNWADHPSLAVLGDGSLVAQWPVINPGEQRPGSYNNSLRIVASRDRGVTWRQVFADGTDNIHSYSGFVSLLPGGPGFHAVYLTPPRPISPDPADHRMTLSHVSVDAGGTATGPAVVDSDTCSCCPTAAALTSEGPIAAYRDHEAGEIRDIAIVRLLNGTWTAPAPVHRDGWVFPGCPTNGPELAADGRQVAAAWFTGAGNVPRMKLSFSTDAGASFGAPIVVSGERPVGRGAIALLPDRSAAVAWLESLAGGAGELRLRRVTAAGEAGRIVTVGPALPGRPTGMPQMVRLGDALLVVWRGPSKLTAARVPLSLL